MQIESKRVEKGNKRVLSNLVTHAKRANLVIPHLTEATLELLFLVAPEAAWGFPLI